MIIIQSQDRETLGKFVEVKVEERVIKAISAYGSMTVLGHYATRERALVVLNEIKKLIVSGTMKDYLSGKYRVKQDVIFIMPEK